MIKEYKNTIWAFSLQIFGMYITVLLINVLVLLNLTSIFDSVAWEWFVTGIITLILYGILWMACAGRGKQDIDIEVLNQKRIQTNPNITFSKQYIWWRGFLAGSLVMSPLVIVMILNSILKDFMIGDIILRIAFSVHVKGISLWGTNPLAIIIYMILFCTVCGLAYMTGPSQKAKINTIIKRNEAKIKSKKI